jgi:hypothetical protein
VGMKINDHGLSSIFLKSVLFCFGTSIQHEIIVRCHFIRDLYISLQVRSSAELRS